MNAWNKIKHGDEENLTGPLVLDKVLWYNSRMKLERNPDLKSRQKELILLKITTIKDLFNSETRQLHTAEELRLKYHTGNFLTWQSMLASIPGEWRRLLQANRPSSTHKPAVYFELEKSGQVAQWPRKRLSKTLPLTTPDKAKLKWEKDLSLGPNTNWKAVFKNVYATTNDVNLRWLALQIIHRYSADQPTTTYL